MERIKKKVIISWFQCDNIERIKKKVNASWS